MILKDRGFVALGVVAVLCAFVNAPAHAAPPAGYTLSWSDEFHEGVGNQPSKSDWSYDVGPNNANHELEIYTDDVQHSQIVADPDATDGQALQILSTDDNGVYHSARMTTGGKHDFKYGFIEARIRMPYGHGIWPAFWTLGSNIGQVGWPACGEMDIMENIGMPSWYSRIQSSLHSRRNGGGTFDVNQQYNLTAGQFRDGYHLFQMWWTPDTISFYVDDHLFETHNKSEWGDNPYPFNDPQFILLNVAVGGGWPGNPDNTTVFPQKMLVDYVRVYNGTPVQPPSPTKLTADAVDTGQIALTWTGDVNATSYNVYRGTTRDVATAAPYKAGLMTGTFVDTGLVAGTRYYYRVASVNPTAASTATDVVSAVAPSAAERPLHGKPAAIPGRIQTADYDLGGEGLAYHDSDAVNQGGADRPYDGVDIETTDDENGGFDVGYTAAGEWLKYTVDVAKSGEYKVGFRVASGATGGTFHLENASGKNLTGPVTVPSTGGWQNWVTLTSTVKLKAGKQVIRLFEDTGGYNFHYLDFTAK